MNNLYNFIRLSIFLVLLCVSSGFYFLREQNFERAFEYIIEPDGCGPSPPALNAINLVVSKNGKLFYYKGERRFLEHFEIFRENGIEIWRHFEDTVVFSEISIDTIGSFFRNKNSKTLKLIEEISECRVSDSLPDSTYHKLLASAKYRSVKLNILATDSCEFRYFLRIMDEANLAQIYRYLNPDLCVPEIKALRKTQQKSKG